jgi:uncharacterized membrane protein YgcG
MSSRFRRCATLLFLFPAAFLEAQSRSLRWKSLEVAARLDAEGRLQVVERHAMIFTGDWNGGERGFRLGLDHRLKLRSVEREDVETGSRIALKENAELSHVDDYAWTDSTTLRWRSRLLTDPPFRDTERVYVITYSLENVLVPMETGYLLDHDFAFPERPGPIDSFSLDLSWDGAWSPSVDLPEKIVRENLLPGQSVVVRAPLSYRGEGAPAGVRTGASPRARTLIAFLFGGAAAAIGLLFYREERILGRFAPLTPPSAIDPSWLEANLFSMLPEEAGAAWDESTGAPEVAAVLARMVSEGKLETEVYESRRFLRAAENLRMRLLVDRRSLTGYESALVRALFVSGDTTDTEKIRSHYRDRGFDPSSILVGPMKQRLQRILRKPNRRISRKPALTLLLLSLLALVLSAFADLAGVKYLIAPMALSGLVYVVGLVAALTFRSRVYRLLPHSLVFLLPAGLIAAAAIAWVYGNSWRNGILALAAFALFALALLTSLFNAAKFRGGATAIEVRKKLASARRYFASELAKRSPHIDDRWFPYLVALELGPDVDRWFRSFGSQSTERSSSPASGGSSSSGSESSGRSHPSWTGGGGAFGGAGATGSWAAAAGSVAAGVAAPSESSSGGSSSGGGGGGGGSSGGGSGGGW